MLRILQKGGHIMARKIPVKLILELRAAKLSMRKIAAIRRISRHSVSEVFRIANERNIAYQDVKDMGDEELYQLFFPEKHFIETMFEEPDYAKIHQELKKVGVTLKLLWEEYTANCRSTGQLCIQYSQFCKLYRDYADRHRLTMHIRHKPGDKMMVDWAGKPLQLHNPVTGTVSKAYIFVGTLPFSMYCFAEAFPDMKEESWINANIHMVQFFGGVARLLIPDNLKTGIVSNRKHEDPVANQAYQEFADHYRTAILPARVLAPKDKAAVEGNVGNF